MVDVLSKEAAAFIRKARSEDASRPFFLYLAPYIPHGPATPPSRYANDFPGLKMPRTPSFNESDVSDKPAWVRRRAPLTLHQIKAIDVAYRKRRQSMQAVEDMVENLIDTLQEQNLLGNTFIFFTSDNGFHQGQHRLPSGKDTAFEEDIAVPLLVRGPGVPAGSTVDRITANVDFAPTFAEIARVPLPSFVDERSLVPFLTGHAPPAWRQALLLEHGAPSFQESRNRRDTRTSGSIRGKSEAENAPPGVYGAKNGGVTQLCGVRQWRARAL